MTYGGPDTTEPGQAPSRAVRKTIIVLSVLAVVTTASQIIAMKSEGAAVTLSHALLMNAPSWTLWALLSPILVFLVARIVRVDRPLPVNLAAHIATAAGIMLLHGALLFPVEKASKMVEATITFPLGVLLVSLWRLPLNVLVYGLVLWIVRAEESDRRLTEQRILAHRLSKQLVESRLHSLQMQLHPHFFFNAMNSVAMLIRDRQNAEATRMIAALSDLLREVLNDSEEGEHTLEQELSFVERYLSIERVRFSDRMRVSVLVPPDVRGARVPRLILQPLVENAVIHGIERNSAEGWIEIAGKHEGSRLLLSVRDGGGNTGKPASTVERGDGGTRDRAGVGLANVRNRLELLYGANAQMRLHVADGNGATGTEAVIEMPFVEQRS